MATINGTANAETLLGTDDADSLFGLDGDDTLKGARGADLLNGGGGLDTASYDTALTGVTVSLVAPASNTGDAEGDTFASIENLTGSAFADILTGNDVANVLMGGGQGDMLKGFGGLDTASYANALGGVVANLTAPAGNTGDAAGDSYSSIENLTGSGFDDVLTGTGASPFANGVNVLSGRGGNDILQGLGGADLLDGGSGIDTASYANAAEGVVASLSAPAGNTGDAAGDSYVSIENLIGSAFDDSLTGNAGANVLTGGAGGDALNGMDGIDTASYAGATAGVVASLAVPAWNTGDAAGDSYLSIENLTGTLFSDTLVGDGGANALSGLDGDDVLRGRAGADVLNGGAGTDTAIYSDATAGVVASLTSPAGNTGDAAGDTYLSIENLIGSGFNDVLTGNGPAGSGSGVNLLSGLSGSDVLQGRAGADVLDGGTGEDAASYANATAAVFASLSTPASNTGEAAGDSYVSIENLIGSAFNDTLVGDSSANNLSGLGGNDVLMSRSGGNLDLFSFSFAIEMLDGGDGSDTASYATATAGVEAFLLYPALNTGEAAGDLYISIENLTGSGFGDILGGDDSNNTLSGLAGDDRLLGDAGADLLNGGAGDDTVDYSGYGTSAGVVASLTNPAVNTGNAAGDTYVSIENLIGTNSSDTLVGNGGANRLYSKSGNDFLYGMGGDDILRGGVGYQTFDGGTGSDTVDYSWLSHSVNRDLALTSWQQWDLFISIENVIGSNHGDVISGDGGVNVLTGLGGDDILRGRGGADVLNGGAGQDTASYAGALTSVVADLATPAANVGDAFGDTFISIENLTGSGLSDTLKGNAGNNMLTGGAGGDVMDGRGGLDTAGYGNATAGVTASLADPSLNTGDAAFDSYISIENLSGSVFADSLTGASGANALSGGDGADILTGLGGKDMLTGGIGHDRFVFTALSDSLAGAPDLIVDFATGDLIDLHLIDADLGIGGDQAFHLDGTFGGAGDIRVSAYDSLQNRTVVELYVDNNASVDARIWLTGDRSNLTEAAFIL